MNAIKALFHITYFFWHRRFELTGKNTYFFFLFTYSFWHRRFELTWKNTYFFLKWPQFPWSVAWFIRDFLIKWRRRRKKNWLFWLSTYFFNLLFLLQRYLNWLEKIPTFFTYFFWPRRFELTVKNTYFFLEKALIAFITGSGKGGGGPTPSAYKK